MESLVVTDLDGTLWGTDLRCHPSTLEAIAELERRSVGLLVATGRRENSARDALAANGLALPSVLLNGALGVDLSNGDRRFHSVCFDADTATGLLAVLVGHGLAPLAYGVDGRVHATPEPTTAPEHLVNIGADWVHGDPAALAEQGNVLAFKMLGVDNGPLARAVQDLGALGVEWSHRPDPLLGQWSLSIQPPKVSKVAGIQSWIELQRRTDGPVPDRIVVLGDGDNDVEMLAQADLALVAADGHQSALDHADVVIDSPEAAGWRQVLDFV